MPKSVFSKDYQIAIKRLKEARLEAGLTQAEVAKKIGKPQSYISKIECGERRVDIAELKILARVYRKSLSFFI
ncbi:helix-turn-helix transcriptional regulator [bacterium]|nr:helix-turn-helix transcriptional regulator [bacterium]